MTTVNWQQLEEAIRAYAADQLPEEAIKRDPHRNLVIDTCFIENDEINVTDLAKAMEKAINLRVD